MEKFEYSEYAKRLRKDAKLVDQAVDVIRKTVKVHGPRAVQAEISGMSRAPVDRGTYRRSFRFDDIPRGAVAYNFAPYASVIEGGRRPGARMPPLEVIFEWVRRHKIGATLIGPVRPVFGPHRQGAKKPTARGDAVERQQRYIALQIARKIKARGLPAHHILRAAAHTIDLAVRKAIDELLAKRRA